jgi:hypothetical protein
LRRIPQPDKEHPVPIASPLISACLRRSSSPPYERQSPEKETALTPVRVGVLRLDLNIFLDHCYKRVKRFCRETSSDVDRVSVFIVDGKTPSPLFLDKMD